MISFWGCNNENSIGVGLLPDGDLINVRSKVVKDAISAYTFNENLIRTDEAKNSLLGSFSDSLFGVTTVDFATQFRLYEFPKFGKNAKADSIRLYLYYRLIYGDTLTQQNFKVYELQQSINPDSDYKQDVDLKSMVYPKLLGEVNYRPKVKLDSATRDTFYQLITIPVDISIAQKLISADSLTMVNNDKFLNYFKGMYVETKKLTGKGGTLLSLEASSTSSFQGSALVLYYHNDDIKKVAGGDSALIMPYVVSQYSARVNRISHDYSSAPFYSQLNKETRKDSLIYVQATGGLKAKVQIDDLSSWADSANVAINKAELIFQIDTVASQVHKFAPPNQLLFTVIDSTGVERLPIDYVFSPTFYGGALQKDYTYHFNITQHVQQIIEGTAQNRGFFLTPAVKSSEGNRVVLKGSTSKTGIRLIITYSKFRT